MTTPRDHLAAGMRCEHKWRYSNSSDVFRCIFCYLTESPDPTPTTPTTPTTETTS